jgi:hypothetical protein
MLETVRKITNPLTVIAIFAGITEVTSSTVLPFVSIANQGTLIWFIVFFPVALIVLFFLTLNFNHAVLYAPSDYRADSSFLAASNIRDSKLLSSGSAQSETAGISFGTVEKAETDV